MREEMKRINANIPESLYSRVLNSEYKNFTEAVIKGLEKLLEPTQEDFSSRANTNTQEGSSFLQERIVKSLEDRISSLESQIAVKDEQIRNQAVHLQTILTQKYIAPPSKKKEENTAVKKEYSQESSIPAQNSNATAQETSEPAVKKNTFETICLYCGTSFTAERKTRKFCSGKCKTAYSRKKN